MADKYFNLYKKTEEYIFNNLRRLVWDKNCRLGGVFTLNLWSPRSSKNNLEELVSVHFKDPWCHGWGFKPESSPHKKPIELSGE
jgi:hypothetical protein